MSYRLLKACGILSLLLCLCMLVLTGLLLFTDVTGSYITPLVLSFIGGLCALFFFKTAKEQEKMIANISDDLVQMVKNFEQPHNKEEVESECYESLEDSEITREDKEKLWKITERHGYWNE